MDNSIDFSVASRSITLMSGVQKTSVDKDKEVSLSINGLPLSGPYPSLNKLDKALLSIASSSITMAEKPVNSSEIKLLTSFSTLRVVFALGAHASVEEISADGSNYLLITKTFPYLEKLQSPTLNTPYEVAVSGLSLAFTPASSTRGIRVKTFSRGTWSPLTPIDTFQADNNGKINVNFSAVAASEILIELLQASQEVLVPAVLALASGITIKTTQQACHVSMAIGDDLPFWLYNGVLPTTPVKIEGLLRAINRYIDDHPDTLTIPLMLKAANEAKIQFAECEFTVQPPTPPKKIETAASQRLVKEDALFKRPSEYQGGQLCNDAYSTAQSFKLEQGIHVSAIELYLRRLTDAPTTLLLSLHADDKRFPAAKPL